LGFNDLDTVDGPNRDSALYTNCSPGPACQTVLDHSINSGTNATVFVADLDGTIYLGDTTTTPNLNLGTAGVVNITSPTTAVGLLQTTQYNSFEAVWHRKAKGTIAAPIALGAGESLEQTVYKGWNGTAFKDAAATGINTQENFGASWGSLYYIATVPIGGTGYGISLSAIGTKVGIGGYYVPNANLEILGDTLGNPVEKISTTPPSGTPPNRTIYQFRGQTTNATPLVLVNLPTTTATVYRMQAVVIARVTTGSTCTAGQGLSCTLTSTFKNVGGTVTQLGANPEITAAACDITSMTCQNTTSTVDASCSSVVISNLSGVCGGSGNTMCVRVTNPSATCTITWNATVMVDSVGN
jgi:hypothetical protein